MSDPIGLYTFVFLYCTGHAIQLAHSSTVRCIAFKQNKNSRRACCVFRGVTAAFVIWNVALCLVGVVYRSCSWFAGCLVSVACTCCSLEPHVSSHSLLFLCQILHTATSICTTQVSTSNARPTPHFYWDFSEEYVWYFTIYSLELCGKS